MSYLALDSANTLNPVLEIVLFCTSLYFCLIKLKDLILICKALTWSFHFLDDSLLLGAFKKALPPDSIFLGGRCKLLGNDSFGVKSCFSFGRLSEVADVHKSFDVDVGWRLRKNFTWRSPSGERLNLNDLSMEIINSKHENTWLMFCLFQLLTPWTI